jgi:hypothetical protein
MGVLMPQGGRYIQCDRCNTSTFSLNLPWNRDGETKRAAREAGWQVEHDPRTNTGEDICPPCQEACGSESQGQQEVHERSHEQNER